MTQVFNDTVETELLIDGAEWLVVEAIVERTREATPDYVDMIIVPDRESAETEIPSRNEIDNLIGAPFELYADNQLISERVTNAEEDSLLFKGNISNITPTGEKSFEALAYDPSQQAFAETEGGGGSLKNTTFRPKPPKYGYNAMYNESSGVTYQPITVTVKELVESALDALNINNYEIRVQKGGIERDGYTGAFNKEITLERQPQMTVKEALEKAREAAAAEWWFDKEGVFHFGLPDPTRHNLQYITDTSAGKTTPPYQSVKVIGSGAASQEGFSRTSMEIEDKIVKEANLAVRESENGKQSIVPDYDPTVLKEPVFEYKNLSVSTDKQAENTVKRIVEDIGEQQAEGKVTVVGFPEVVPLDGIVMPQATDNNGENYNPRQPMGGYGYNVYKVTHFLNGSDGFTTEIEVSGLTGITKEIIGNEPEIGVDANQRSSTGI